LRRTIQRQLSPKLTFALAETTYGTGDGLLVARCSLDGGNMRIADMQPSGPMVRVRPGGAGQRSRRLDTAPSNSERWKQIQFGLDAVQFRYGLWRSFGTQFADHE
jgi:hypothetical protein